MLAVVTVTTLADTIDFNDGVTSLREAVFATNTVPGADTIEFDPSLTAGDPQTILLEHGELAITEALTINGPGASHLTIDAHEQSRIFNITATTGDFTISGLTLTGGRTTGDNLSGSDTTYSGGAIRSVTGGQLTLDHCTVSGNLATGGGGGIYSRYSVTLTGSIVSGNSTTGNYARGGAISCRGLVTLTQSIVSNNSTAGRRADGGGIHANGVALTQSTVSGNRTTGDFAVGGGISTVPEFSLLAPGIITLIESTVSGNSTAGANANGGGMIGGKTALTQSTITDNHATGSGALVGGLSGSTVDSSGSIIAGNTATAGNPDLRTSGTPIVTNSLIGDSTGTTLVEAPVGSPDANGNLIGGPVNSVIDPKLGPLADNGGFELPDGSHILTHALLPGSPAINAGDLNAVAGQGDVPEFDQRGELFGRVVGGRIDIGAFEYQTPTDLNLLVDTLEDESDGDYSRGDLSLREAIELANANDYADVVDTIRFDPALTASGQATIRLTQGELAITDSVTINGPGADLLTIDASGNDPTPDSTLDDGDNTNDGDGSRVFNVVGDAAGGLLEVSIGGLTLTGGDAALQGGGILGIRANITVEHAIVLGNSSRVAGGGIAHGRGSLTVIESTITENAAPYGGGINVSYVNSPLAIQSSEVSSNIATRDGGGIIVSGSNVSIAESMITGNTVTAPRGGAGGAGGGVHFRGQNGSSLTIRSSRLEGNSAAGPGGSGGGLYATGGPVEITNTTIASNSADSYGGGLSLFGGVENATIRGTTITGNTALAIFGRGGGLYAGQGQGHVRIEYSTFSGNSAPNQGGAISSGRFMEILDSTIADNAVTGTGGWGGGIASGNSPLTVTRTLITGNTAGRNGGGLYSVSADATFIASTIVGNSANEDGGGIAIRFGHVVVRETAIQDNHAGQNGGAIRVGGYGSLEIDNSTVNGNSAVGSGGGIYSSSFAGTVSVQQSTLSGNRANGNGGGVSLRYGATFAHTTITLNYALQTGGGIFTSYGPVTLSHSIVAGNNGTGRDIAGLLGAVILPEYSLIGSNGGNGLTPAPVGTPDASGNLIGGSSLASMIYPKLGPLADNGGPTMTHALLPGSPAIDAGDPLAMAGVDGVPDNDQRGMPWSRVANGDDVPEARIDMGAVEWQANPLAGDYNFDGVVNAADYSVWRDTLGSSTDLRADGDGDSAVDADDYDVWRGSFGSVLAAGGGGLAAELVIGSSGELAPQSLADPASGYPEGVAAVVSDRALLPLESGPLRMANTLVKPPAEPGADGRVSVAISNRDDALLAWAAQRRGATNHAITNVALDRNVDRDDSAAIASLDAVFAGLGGLPLL